MNPSVLPAAWSATLHSVLRIVTGLLFLEHGMAKLFGFPHVAMFDGLKIGSLMGVAALLEFFGGILLTLGLFTRITAFVLCGFMAVAYFMAHAPKSFFPLLNQGELAIVFCFVFLYIAAAGAGPWSLDANRGVANP